MTLVIDDRMKVWDEKDQHRVHAVSSFAPYYAPQAEVLTNAVNYLNSLVYPFGLCVNILI